MTRKPYLLAVLSGLLLFLIFPNFLGLELWPLAGVALVPLLLALESSRSTAAAARIAAVTGLVAYSLTYHWLVYCMHTYAHMSYLVSVLVLLAMVAVLMGFTAAFGALYHFLGRTLRFPGLILAPAAWTALEYLRTYFPFGGFPWALLGYSQVKFPALIQIAEFTGPYGVSFLVVLTNAGLAQAILAGTRGSRPPPDRGAAPGTPGPAGSSPAARFRAALPPLLVGLGAPLLAVIFGLIRVPLVDRALADQPELKLGIVQANIDQGVKWSQEAFWDAMDRHLELTQALAGDQPRLVIWPEAAITVGSFNDHWARRSPVVRFIAQVDTYFLTGSISAEPCGQDRCYFNSVYLFSPGAENLLGRYDKIHLVPFGEYVPLKKLFFFADAIAKGNTGATTPGRELKVMSLPEAQFGCVICYEVIFPNLVRRFVAEGADFMTTVTNDAWFGNTGAPYQHHAAVVFRAVENRVYFARAANTGISSIVDPAGRVLHSTGIYVPASFTGIVKPSPIRTFYTRYGDLFAWINAAAMIAALGLGLVLAGQARRPSVARAKR